MPQLGRLGESSTGDGDDDGGDGRWSPDEGEKRSDATSTSTSVLIAKSAPISSAGRAVDKAGVREADNDASGNANLPMCTSCGPNHFGGRAGDGFLDVLALEHPSPVDDELPP